MLNSKKTVVILPAYNAERTLEKTYLEIPHHIVDEIILTDDYSSDKTVSVAKKIGIKQIIEHDENFGYAVLTVFFKFFLNKLGIQFNFFKEL
ncbi:glycosyltransferase [uncultured Aquimarina sp.]|uniref:glycosyltransferase n=1 Tax=uncultured Aquimarina sp. TaxID=575652 RepID=UPI00260B2B19|nr:glycosyltransferase [uncultured Aquimarina sp.]